MSSLKPVADSFKDAALWAFISNLLVFGGAFATTFGFIVSAVGTVLYFMYAWSKLKRALTDLSTLGVQIGNAVRGTDYVFYSFAGITFGDFIALIGVAITFLGAIQMIHIAAGLITLGDVVTILSVILYLLGSIPIGMAVYNFGLSYNSDLMRIGGILIIIPGVSILGWLFAYIEVDNIVTRGGTRFQTPSVSQPSAQVYPEGPGTLNSNGEATVTLVSNAFLQVVNAFLQGYPGVTFVSALPNTLNLGRNVMTIRFSNLPPLSPGTYYVIIAFNNGISISVPVNYS